MDNGDEERGQCPPSSRREGFICLKSIISNGRLILDQVGTAAVMAVRNKVGIVSLLRYGRRVVGCGHRAAAKKERAEVWQCGQPRQAGSLQHGIGPTMQVADPPRSAKTSGLLSGPKAWSETGHNSSASEAGRDWQRLADGHISQGGLGLALVGDAILQESAPTR